MEKGDKKKPAKKKIIKQKQKQKQEQTVIVNVTQPIKKPKKRRIYKPKVNIKTQYTNPIKNITSYQIPTERAEVYRPIQQPAPAMSQQQPPQPQAPSQQQAPMMSQPLRSKSEFIPYDEPKLRSTSELIYEEPPLIAPSFGGGLLEEENKLKLIKEKIKKVNYTLDTFNNNAELQHEEEIMNNSEFYNNNVYDEDIEAERLDEIQGSGAGEYSVQAPIFTTDNLFNENQESEKIEESGSLQFLSKISQIIEDVVPDVIPEEERRQKEEERRQKKAERAEIEKRKDAERMERNRREQEMINTGLYKLELGKWVLKEPELKATLQEGGELIPTREQEGLIIQGGDLVGVPSEDLMEKRGGGGGAMEKGEGKFTKEMIIDIRQNYINILNESGDPQGIADAQQKQLDKYKLSTKNQSDTALKSMFYDYQKKLSTINEMYDMYKQMEEGEELY
jgi:hypothetical protein